MLVLLHVSWQIWQRWFLYRCALTAVIRMDGLDSCLVRFFKHNFELLETVQYLWDFLWSGVTVTKLVYLSIKLTKERAPDCDSGNGTTTSEWMTSPGLLALSWWPTWRYVLFACQNCSRYMYLFLLGYSPAVVVSRAACLRFCLYLHVQVDCAIHNVTYVLRCWSGGRTMRVFGNNFCQCNEVRLHDWLLPLWRNLTLIILYPVQIVRHIARSSTQNVMIVIYVDQWASCFVEPTCDTPESQTRTW
jgi:hypothetical protein